MVLATNLLLIGCSLQQKQKEDGSTHFRRGLILVAQQDLYLADSISDELLKSKERTIEPVTIPRGSKIKWTRSRLRGSYTNGYTSVEYGKLIDSQYEQELVLSSVLRAPNRGQYRPTTKYLKPYDPKGALDQ